MQKSTTFAVQKSGRSSVRLEYTSGGRVVAGSNPVTPTKWKMLKINGKAIFSTFFLFQKRAVATVFIATMLPLPQSDLSGYPQIKCSRRYAQRPEHSAHCRKGHRAFATLQLAYLGTFHPYALAEFLLRKMLLQACFLYGLAYVPSINFLFKLSLHCIPFGSSDFSPNLITYLFVSIKFHLCYRLRLFYRRYKGANLFPK